MPHIQIGLVLGGLLGGLAIGVTGMGGGALLAPMLVLVFGVDPAAAVGGDLVTSLIIKPVGGAVHLRQGTVRLDLACWLCLGSVPGAVIGVLILKALGDGASSFISVALGVTLLVATAAMVYRDWIKRRPADAIIDEDPPARPAPTVVLGLCGGIVVGMTSVGSGSLMIVVMTMLYPSLSRSRLVGTDLVQAIPLVGSAAVSHLVLLHTVKLAVTASLVIGALPGDLRRGATVVPVRRSLAEGGHPTAVGGQWREAARRLSSVA